MENYSDQRYDNQRGCDWDSINEDLTEEQYRNIGSTVIRAVKQFGDDAEKVFGEVRVILDEIKDAADRDEYFDKINEFQEKLTIINQDTQLLEALLASMKEKGAHEITTEDTGDLQSLERAVAQNQHITQYIQQQLDQIVESGYILSRNQVHDLEQYLPEILAESEQYLENFIPEFKETFDIKDIYQYSDNIDGFGNYINSILQLSNGDVLVVGGKGETRLLQPQPDGGYQYSDKIEGFSDVIWSPLQLSNGDILAGGNEGETRLLQPQPDGSYEYSDNIDGFEKSINSTLQLPNGDVLAAGGNTRLLQPQPDGSYQYSDSIAGFEEWIHSTLQLPNGDVLVAGSRGNTRLLQPPPPQAQNIRDNVERILG